MAEKVFISYSHQDSVCAHGIARFLARHGCDVWIDSEKLSLGSKWSSDINDALARADVTIGILSASSVRRKEVLKEIGISMKRMKEEGIEHFRLLFVVVGKIHRSWFSDPEASREIIDYLSQYQYIELSAYGEITIDTMKKLLQAIRNDTIKEGHFRFQIEEENAYINQNALPEKTFDNRFNQVYYRTYPADLSASCVYPFALDSQWLMEKMYDPSQQLYDEFGQYGFASKKVKEELYTYKRDNFYLSLLHFKQIVIRRECLLSDPYFIELIRTEDRQRDAFKKLLANGSIVLFLYGNRQITPFVYDRKDEPSKAYNQLCSEVPVYCIRENWANPIDSHSIEFLRFCCNLASEKENNILLAETMHLKDRQIDEFLLTLKTISMQAFCQTHMNGTGKGGSVDGYFRSLFYRNYIVKEEGEDPIDQCLIDPDKPFAHELKRLVDIYYNSIFINSFQCDALTPYDTKAENTYLNRLYLKHGEKEVSIEELEYAFAEFFSDCEILDEIGLLNDYIDLKDYDLDRICALRQKEEWQEYTELLEMIARRSNSWKVDFNEIELLLQRLLRCFDENDPRSTDKKEAAYTFRVCVGSRVLDIVRTERISKLKEYIGSYDKTSEVPLTVQFSIGDLSREEKHLSIGILVTLFDGRIDMADGSLFFNRLKDFLIQNHSFIMVS